MDKAFAANAVPQHNQAGRCDRIDFRLQGLAQIFGAGVQTVIQKCDAVFQLRWKVAGKQLLKDTAGNKNDGEVGHIFSK